MTPEPTNKSFPAKALESLNALLLALYNNPVLVRTGLAAAVSAGVLTLSDGQITKINSIVFAVVFLWAAITSRAKVDGPITSESKDNTIDALLEELYALDDFAPASASPVAEDSIDGRPEGVRRYQDGKPGVKRAGKKGTKRA